MDTRGREPLGSAIVGRVQPDPPDLLRLALGQGGVVTTAQARSVGLTADQLRRRVRSGQWERPYRSVYVVRAGRHSAVWAAVLAAGPVAVVSGHLAAVMYDLQPVSAPRPEVSTSARVAVRGLRVRRRHLAPDDVCLVLGVPVTAPMRTMLDALADADRLNAVWTVEQALRRRLVERVDIDAALAAEWRGVRRARQRWALVDERSESPLETAIRLALMDHGVPRPELQVVVGGGEPVARLDMFWPGQRVAVEADGRGPHSEPTALFRDRDRQNRLMRAGIRLLRYTWRDLGNPKEMAREVSELLAGRAQMGAGAAAGRPVA